MVSFLALHIIIFHCYKDVLNAFCEFAMVDAQWYKKHNARSFLALP